jgi:GH24 family phage-related lysozyme (muramidase)
MLTITIAAAFGLAIFLGYRAGADTNDRETWTRKARERQQAAAQYEAAMAPSRQRHPSSRRAA